MTKLTTQALWLSLGENCLPDALLQKFAVKSFSTPYTAARSNIDYALALEKINYDGLLDPRNLKKEYAADVKKEVVRSTIINHSDSIYEKECSNGFEFTHHDVLNDEQQRQSFKRKITRMRTIRGQQNCVFLYHYRGCEQKNINNVLVKVQQFSEIYAQSGRFCFCGVFTHSPVYSKNARAVKIARPSKNVMHAHFYVAKKWRGQDFIPRVLIDDIDLFTETFARIKTDVAAHALAQA